MMLIWLNLIIILVQVSPLPFHCSSEFNSVGHDIPGFAIKGSDIFSTALKYTSLSIKYLTLGQEKKVAYLGGLNF
jgi:hypothetical protein